MHISCMRYCNASRIAAASVQPGKMSPFSLTSSHFNVQSQQELFLLELLNPTSVSCSQTESSHFIHASWQLQRLLHTTLRFCIEVLKFKFIAFLRAEVKKQCKDKFGTLFKFALMLHKGRDGKRKDVGHFSHLKCDLSPTETDGNLTGLKPHWTWAYWRAIKAQYFLQKMILPWSQQTNQTEASKSSPG